MKILFISDNFPPEVNAPASRTYEHCVRWAKWGHDITVITCAPNFPSGKVFPGYRNRLWQVEHMDGLRVIRVWSFITANEGFLLRICDFLSFMVTSILAALFVRKPDVVVGTSPQFFTACSACVVAWLKRRPFVFELRDIWPESIKAVGAMKNSRAIRFLERIEILLYRRAALIVAVTRGFKTQLVEHGVPADKITVVTNGADLSRYAPRPPDDALNDELGLRDRFVVGYIGTHGMAHGLSTIVQAAAKLQDHPIGKRCFFLFVGGGADRQRLMDEARTLGLRNIRFVESVSKEQVVRYWSVLDVTVMHLLDNALFSTVIPSKLFEGMAMGIPALSSVPGEAREILEECEVGHYFRAQDSDDFIRALLDLMNDPDRVVQMKARCVQAARLFDRTNLATAMAQALIETVQASRHPKVA